MKALKAEAAQAWEPWVDTATVVAHTGYSERTIREYAAEGILLGQRLGKGKARWRFRLSEVDAALLANRRSQHIREVKQ